MCSLPHHDISTLNSINLALDAVWRFADLPDAYYHDWLKVADEEALHFSLLRKHLTSAV